MKFIDEQRTHNRTHSEPYFGSSMISTGVIVLSQVKVDPTTEETCEIELTEESPEKAPRNEQESGKLSSS